MGFFILPHKADLYKKNLNSPGKDRSGQIQGASLYSPTAILIPKCLFYSYTGSKDVSPRKDFDQTAAFYCEAGVDIDEGDKIQNIRGLDAFEAGPFEVLNVRYVTGFNGRVHHITCKVRGITG